MIDADWYDDPSGKFERRYWDGTSWTEHVVTGWAEAASPLTVPAPPPVPSQGLSRISPVGHRITSCRVLGTERDIGGCWLGADLVLEVDTAGRFSLNVQTREYFLDEGIRDCLDGVESLERLLDDSDRPPAREVWPFVLNVPAITHEILKRTFLGRVVDHGLAASL